MALNKQLEQLGLTEKETRVFLGLLEIGEATAQQISIKSGVNRATTYVLLEGFVRRGIVKAFKKEKKTFFKVESPLEILEILEKDKRLIEDRIKVARQIMPELELISRVTKGEAKVKFYHGKDEIALMQRDILKSKAKVLDTIFNINRALDFFPVSDNDHRQVFRQNKLKGRVIVVYDPSKPIPVLPPVFDEDRRYLPVTKNQFNAEFTLYKNKIAMLSEKDNILGLIIENKEIVDGFRFIYDLAWKGAEKYKAIKGKVQK